MKGVFSRDTFSVNLNFFLIFMVDMKNIEGVFSRNTFKSGEKYHIFENIFIPTIF